MTTLSSFRVAVVGGGVAGTTAAVLLRNAGAQVDLFEARTALDGGSGIMLQSNALRVLRSAGALEAVVKAGYGFDSTGVRVPDATTRLVAEIPARTDPGTPGALGIERSRLAELLRERAAEVGVRMHAGVKVVSVRTTAQGTEIGLRSASSSSVDAFDLVVGADGLGSSVRRLIGIQDVPRHLDLGVWRVLIPRPRGVVRAEIVNGGAAYFAGFAPTSETTMYAWLVDDYVDRRALDTAAQLDIVRSLADGYHGPWDEIRSAFTPETPVSYTRYSELLLPAPWHRGRTVLIGDAVHACPPTLAQGAAMGLEDALVLADVVSEAGRVEDELLDVFAARRWPRAAQVVDASVRLAEWQLRHERGEPERLMAQVGALLDRPA